MTTLPAPEWLATLVGTVRRVDVPGRPDFTFEELEQLWAKALEVTNEDYPHLGRFNGPKVTNYQAQLWVIAALQNHENDVPNFIYSRPPYGCIMLDRWEMDKYGIIGATIDEQGRIKPHKPVRAMKDSILVLRVQGSSPKKNTEPVAK